MIVFFLLYKAGKLRGLELLVALDQLHVQLIFSALHEDAEIHSRKLGVKQVFQQLIPILFLLILGEHDEGKVDQQNYESGDSVDVIGDLELVLLDQELLQLGYESLLVAFLGRVVEVEGGYQVVEVVDVVREAGHILLQFLLVFLSLSPPNFLTLFFGRTEVMLNFPQFPNEALVVGGNCPVDEGFQKDNLVLIKLLNHRDAGETEVEHPSEGNDCY